MSVTVSSDTEHSARHAQEPDQEESDVDHLTISFNGLKINFEMEYEVELTEDSGIDEEIELEMLDDIEFGRKLAEMPEREDLDWIPRVLRRVEHRR